MTSDQLNELRKQIDVAETALEQSLAKCDQESDFYPRIERVHNKVVAIRMDVSDAQDQQ